MKKEKTYFYLLLIAALLSFSVPILYSFYNGFLKGSFFPSLFGQAYWKGIYGFVLMLIKTLFALILYYALAIICLVFAIIKVVNYNKKSKEKIKVGKPITVILISYILLLIISFISCNYLYKNKILSGEQAKEIEKYLSINYPDTNYKLVDVLENSEIASCGGAFNACTPMQGTEHIMFLVQNKNNKLKVKYEKYSDGRTHITDESKCDFSDVYDECDNE